MQAMEIESNTADVCAIAQPLADDKLTKKIFKVIKKAGKEKLIRRGVKEVVKAIRKGGKGFVVLAGDISPIDVISHIPIMCEDAGITYIYVASKEDLGAASGTKRPTSVILVTVDDSFKYKELYDEAVAAAAALAPSF
ncbi:H/ACA ribonucleoprotein complex subunit 2 [Thecamonas trahens ATCC 50062]|uniref:H/ACA ribonucleoprotein complex subunit 2 n=1 Tax=Thecamonas trahens ATCC 50062 TaxID=461836 RepID=A0A0L0DAJ2_THETB|nr:H/ACA ribonucleoprotein complex subunit 2 [Thecamonas trahens ATCC 50062]KNC49379.1 H/ACA ribonucleoprotein complex subunit 2 [Thecamonas trahens ATCC 50062]|eukprot:XP_013757804.1 H/ACA ribonucleoprotein complex subunit 2 [Thecamonas trahens ATCC 50062]